MNILSNIYVNNHSYLHKIDGSLKLLLLLVWSYFIFSVLDIRIFIISIIIGYAILLSAKIPVKLISGLTIAMIIFTVSNSLLLILVSPEYGSELTETTTGAFSIGYATVTYETLFYSLTLSTKYLALFPVTLIFILTTNPAKFAASLNKLKVPYKAAYAVSITLRYIPTIGQDFINIKYALELKGVRFKYKNPIKSLGSYMKIIPPLISIALNKVDAISDGMELREFGKYQTRTWYESQQYQKIDYYVVMILVIILIMGTYFWIIDPSFYYPFI